MKVTETRGVISSAVAGTAAVTPAAPEPVVAVAPVTPVDKVTTDEASRLGSSTAQAVEMAASERAVRLASLARAVRAGAYRPNAMAVAEQMLAAAELDARLAHAMA